MVDVENRGIVAMSEVHPAPSSNWIAPRVSGLNPENSSSVNNPAKRTLASIASAFERFGSSKMPAISRSRCSMTLKTSR